MDGDTLREIRSEILPVIAQIYPMQVWTLEELGGYRNWVCQISCGDAPLVLRVTPASHRSLRELDAEVTLVATLYEHNVPVAAPVELPGVPRISRVTLGERVYYITAFEKAAGLTWNEMRQGPREYREAGRVLAKIHRVTEALSGPVHRAAWDGNDYIRNAKRVLPPEKRWVLPQMGALVDELRSLPRDEQEYGLVHGDYHFANMLYAPTGLTVIDFDEAEYHWYAYDLAVYLFYYLLGRDPARMDLTAGGEVWQHFVEGYRTERALPARLAEELPSFLRLREYMLYSSVYEGVSLKPWGEWQRSFIAAAEERFRTGRPFVEVERLYQWGGL